MFYERHYLIPLESAVSDFAQIAILQVLQHLDYSLLSQTAGAEDSKVHLTVAVLMSNAGMIPSWFHDRPVTNLFLAISS